MTFAVIGGRMRMAPKTKFRLLWNNYRLLYSVFLFLFISVTTTQGKSSARDSVERELQKTVSRKIEFEKNKLKQIFDLKEKLNLAQSLRDRYRTQAQLYQAFRTFQIDSAIYYVDENMAIARTMKDSLRRFESAIQLASLYSSGGRFIESERILRGIPREQLPEQLVGAYFKAFTDFYSHYGQSTNHYPYFTQSEIYRDSLLHILPKESVSYRIEQATRAVFEGDFHAAEPRLLKLLLEFQESDHERAVVAYLLGILYKGLGDSDRQIYYLGLSAIADIKNAVKDNASLQSLALIYFEQDDIDNAYLFIQEAMEDALFCNVRYRTIENSSFYPIINSAFQAKEDARKKELQTSLYTISILSGLLIILLSVLYWQMKKLKRTRADLKVLNTELRELNERLFKVNEDLQESNHIKEEYMAQFFELCSAYIDKLDNTRKGILKKLAQEQYDGLNNELKSQDFIKTELEDLYRNFDVIFLSLYPTFIDEFNNLLRPEEQLQLKAGELLNSELRIFALIRLGISDSTKIARFLRYSLRTVYNYRVKVRNKVAGSKEEFDEKIRAIGNIHPIR